MPFPANSPADERQNLAYEAPHRGNETIFDADALNHANEPSATTQSSDRFPQNEQNGAKNYHSTSESPNALDGQDHTFATPATENFPTTERRLNARPTVYTNATPDVAEFKDAPPDTSPLSPYPPSSVHPRTGTSPRRSLHGSTVSRRGSMYEVKQKVGGILPRCVRKPLWAWLDRVSMVLSPEWIKTTLLMWTVWFAVSLGVTFHGYYKRNC
jgi:hypothetical protein